MFGNTWILCFALVLASVTTNASAIVNEERAGHSEKDVQVHGNCARAQHGHYSWKECAWSNINHKADSGIVKSCKFNKKSPHTYLKVVVRTVMRIFNCNKCCMRWFVTFDGQECKPVAIDGVVFMKDGAGKNLLRTRAIGGNCHIGKTGPVNVQLQVGKCGTDGDINTVFGISDANTGWNSSTRIYIEEVDPPQE